jgi:hypothetical protein
MMPGGSGSASIAREVSTAAVAVEKATGMRAAKQAMVVKVATDKATTKKVAVDKVTVMKAAEEAVAQAATDAAVMKTTD